MPTAPVDQDGSFLYYEDSGAPEGSNDYLTIILVHGYLVNGASYNHALPFAKRYNMRFIALNLRGYRGSSPCDPAGVARPTENPEADAQRDGLRSQGRELAYFAAHIIRQEHIPTISVVDGKRCGGLAILGWSAGNAVLISMLAEAEFLDADVKVMLDRYLRSVVIDDGPCLLYGVELPDVYIPINDPNIPRERVAEAFMPWVSAYWSAVTSLADLEQSDLDLRRPVHEQTADPKYQPSCYRMAFDNVVEPAAAVTVNNPILLRPDILRRQAIKALFDTGGVWKDVDVLVLWGEMSSPFSVWGAKHLHDWIHAVPVEGAVRRKINVRRLEGANHFVHLDDPEKFVLALVEYL